MQIELLDTFITGHPVIDAEHGKIVDSINQVSEAVRKGQFDRCAILLDDFLKTCKNHFKAEEALLAELGYPGLSDHAAFHRELVLKAKAVRALCMDMNNPDSIQRCFDEMATLLIEDVVKGDLQFVSFLIEKDVVEPRTMIHPPKQNGSSG